MRSVLLDILLRVGIGKTSCCITGFSRGYFCAGNPFFANNQEKITLSAVLQMGFITRYNVSFYCHINPILSIQSA